MPGDAAKFVGGLIVAGVGLGFGQPGLVYAGIGMASAGMAGIVKGDGGEVSVGLARRQQGMLLRNRPSVGAVVPVVYGTARLGVIPVDYRVDTGSTDNKDLYVPAVVCHGSRDGYGVAALEEVYFNEEAAFASDGTVKPRFAGKAYKTDILGTDSETWSATEVDGEDLVGVTGNWSADDDGKGLAGVLFKLIYDRDVYNGIPTITVKTVGNLVEDTRDELTGNTVFAAGAGNAITHLDVSEGAWASGDRVEVTSGVNAGMWTVDNVSGDHINIIETLASDTYTTTIKRWAHPDNGGDNPALCVRDYLLSAVYGMGGMIVAADIDDTSFEAMANAYDTADAPDGIGGTQARFKCNGWLDTGKSVKANLAELLSSCRGNLVYQGGKWRLFTTWTASAETFELSEDNILGDTWSFANAGPESKYNISRATFANLDDNYTPDEVQWPKTGAANSYLTADNSVESRLSVDLPLTTDIVMAEQIAMIRLLESRQGITAMVIARESAAQLQIGHVVKVTHETPGWTEKLFWVVGVRIRPDDFNVELTLREYDAAAYSYDAQTTSSDDADTDLPNPFEVTPATGMALTAGYNTTGVDVTTPRILVEWTDSNHTFVDRYVVSAKRHPTKFYNEVTFNSGGYVTTATDLFGIGLFRVGDKFRYRGTGGVDNYDGVYTITSFDYSSGFRVNVTPAPPSSTSAVFGWVAEVNAFQAYASVEPGVEQYTIELPPVKLAAEEWIVKLDAVNTLGLRGQTAENVIQESDDISEWFGSIGVETGGQADPDAGSNAWLLGDDTGVAIELKSYGQGISGIDYGQDGSKRFAGYIKGSTATVSQIAVWDYVGATSITFTIDIAWSGATPALSIAGGGLLTGRIIDLRDTGVSDWWYVEFEVDGLYSASETYLRIYPGGDEAADTGNILVYRWHASDDNKKIVTPLETAGSETSHVTVPTSIAVPASYSEEDGDGTTGDVSDVQVIFDGANVLTLDEATGTPGFNAQFTFAGLGFVPNRLVVRSHYIGSAAHDVTVDMYDYDASAWVQVSTVMFSSNHEIIDVEIPQQQRWVDSGAALVRWYHNDSGNASHSLVIDYVSLQLR